MATKITSSSSSYTYKRPAATAETLKKVQQYEQQPAAYKQSSTVTAAQKKLNQYTTAPTYKAAPVVADAKKNMDTINAQRPGAYESNWQTQINDTVNAILNGQKFSYDYNADPMYQQYSQAYTRNGQRAMQDTMGEATALTGGYGSSYATTAAQQTYNNYMQELNNIIPQLEQIAYGRYQDEIANNYSKVSMLQGLDDTDYGRYRDTMGDWENDRDYATNQYWNTYNMDYGQYQDRLGQWNTDRNYAYDVYNNERTFDYGQYRDMVADQLDWRDYYYGKSQNELSDAWQNEQMNYAMWEDAMARAAAGRGGKGKEEPETEEPDPKYTPWAYGNLPTQVDYTNSMKGVHYNDKTGEVTYTDTTDPYNNIYSATAMMGADPYYQDYAAREAYKKQQNEKHGYK